MLSRRDATAAAPAQAAAPAVPSGRAGDAPAGAEGMTWVEALRADGPAREQALAELHALLLRAARFEARRAGVRQPAVRETLEDIAQQSADDALVAILAKLGTFRGDSRFTTWAYKFAILETAVALRRHAWQGREIPLEDDRWGTLRGGEATPGAHAHARELLAAVRAAIDEQLTAHQRRVLVAVTLDGVPIDVLAERLGTTRGALYKTLHDARRRLRARLAERGFDLSGMDAEEES